MLLGIWVYKQPSGGGAAAVQFLQLCCQLGMMTSATNAYKAANKAATMAYERWGWKKGLDCADAIIKYKATCLESKVHAQSHRMDWLIDGWMDGLIDRLVGWLID